MQKRYRQARRYSTEAYKNKQTKDQSAQTPYEEKREERKRRKKSRPFKIQIRRALITQFLHLRLERLIIIITILEICGAIAKRSRTTKRGRRTRRGRGCVKRSRDLVDLLF